MCCDVFAFLKYTFIAITKACKGEEGQYSSTIYLWALGRFIVAAEIVKVYGGLEFCSVNCDRIRKSYDPVRLFSPSYKAFKVIDPPYCLTRILKKTLQPFHIHIYRSVILCLYTEVIQTINKITRGYHIVGSFW